ncbi:MAG: T9SS type A sorting domain-containing protein [Candidatus Zixiibacteriota bacterium]|nr:MAG: T9SS type A sorting domain-containing protein [candidate division Zixibacteria bacterium]
MSRFLLVALIALPVVSLAGTDDVPIFTGCPTELRGNHCDSMFFQVSAIDPRSGGPSQNIRYHLIQGPGEIDEKTGLWIYHPELDDPLPNIYIPVEIAASMGKDTTSGDQNCRFGIAVVDWPPMFESSCGAHISVLPYDTAAVPVSVIDWDSCDQAWIESFEVDPQPDGRLDLDTAEGLLTFVPSYFDKDKTFTVTLHANPGIYHDRACKIYFDTFVPDPIRVRVEKAETNYGADTVAVDLVIEECPVGLDRMDFLVEYDEAKLRFLTADSGPAFFSETDGCAWEYFRARPYPSCIGDSVRAIVSVSARADDGRAPYPSCGIPDNLPAKLGTLKFQVIAESMPAPEFVPLAFYWCYCNNNVLLSEDCSVSFYPHAVYDHRGRELRPQPVPGYAGTSLECFLQSTGPERVRQVELHNGGVEIWPVDSVEPTVVRIEVQDGDGQGVPLGLETTVDIILDESPRELGGFDFLVKYPETAFNFLYAAPGEFLEQCEWEYFTYRFGPDANCTGGCPPGIVRIVAIADVNDIPVEVVCYLPDAMPSSLVELHFLVSSNGIFEGSFQPIRFMWFDCGDNSMSLPEGLELHLSRCVRDHDSVLVPNDTVFPTFGGAVASCFEMGLGVPVPSIDYYNGGVQIIGDDDIDATGDFNMNGLSYETADLSIFNSYFLNGPRAFDPYGGPGASDINRDGIPLSLADFIYMTRVVVGDMLPDSVIEPAELKSKYCLSSEASETSLFVEAANCLIGMYFVFDGAISPVQLNADISWQYNQYENKTRVLVNDWWGCGPGLRSPVLTYTGEAELSEIHGVTDSLQHVFFEEHCDLSDETVAIRLQTDYPAECGALQGHYLDISIMLDFTSEPLGGYDLLIAYDDSALLFQEAHQGPVLDSCDWEYFDYRVWPDSRCPECSSGVLQIIGFAETNDGDNHPSCFLEDNHPIQLATLKFLVSNDRRFECQFLPLRFIWVDCGDNVVSDKDGLELYMSRSVYDYDSTRMSGDLTFPTLTGAPPLCQEGAYGEKTPSIDFFNGGVQVCCGGTIDTTHPGDININGVPYEIADLVMFINYFIYGSAAFDHVEESIANSDVNGDGDPLTVEDLTYLYLIIIGEAAPYPNPDPSPNVAEYCVVESSPTEIYIQTEDCVGAVHFQIQGEATELAAPEGTQLSYHFDGDITRVMLTGEWMNFGAISCIETAAGPVLSFMGGGELLKIEGATSDGVQITFVESCPTDVDTDSDALPTEFSLSQNYPNPFNPMTKIEFALPRASDVEIAIYNITGRRVRTLVNREMTAGYHSVDWYGEDDAGNRVASGIYLYRITVGEFVQTRKMLLLK